MENLRKYIMKNFTEEEVLRVIKRLNRFPLLFLLYYFTGKEALDKFFGYYYHLNIEEQRLVRKAVLTSFINNLKEERRKRI